MKKTMIAIAAVIMLAACNSGENTATETTVDSTAVDSVAVDSVKVDSAIAK